MRRTYVAEQVAAERRGDATSLVRMAGTLGLVLALAVIMLCRGLMEAKSFAAWGWRVPL
jgi:hypothetical protein